MNTYDIDAAKLRFGDDTVIEDVDLDDEVIMVDGERLTDERADQIAADVLAKVRSRTLVPGGKSLSGDGTHSPVVQTRVSEATHSALKALAKAKGMSVSKLSRQVLDRYVAANVPFLEEAAILEAIQNEERALREQLPELPQD